MTHEFMYPYLEYAIQVRKVKIGWLADEMGMALNSLSRKLHGKSPFRLDEAVQIKKLLNVKWSIDKLFSRIDETKMGGLDNGDVA